MNKLTFFSLFILLMAGCVTPNISRDELQVPNEVLKAFSEKFPDAEIEEWEKEAEDIFEVSFQESGKSMSSNFNLKGEWLETETTISKVDLPQAIHDAITHLYPGYQIEKAESCQQVEKALSYEFELKNERTDDELEATFDVNGNLISTETDKDEDEEE